MCCVHKRNGLMRSYLKKTKFQDKLDEFFPKPRTTYERFFRSRKLPDPEVSHLRNFASRKLFISWKFLVLDASNTITFHPGSFLYRNSHVAEASSAEYFHVAEAPHTRNFPVTEAPPTKNFHVTEALCT